MGKEAFQNASFRYASFPNEALDYSCLWAYVVLYPNPNHYSDNFTNHVMKIPTISFINLQTMDRANEITPMGDVRIDIEGQEVVPLFEQRKKNLEQEK